jgi:hypothetical protein
VAFQPEHVTPSVISGNKLRPFKFQPSSLNNLSDKAIPSHSFFAWQEMSVEMPNPSPPSMNHRNLEAAVPAGLANKRRLRTIHLSKVRLFGPFWSSSKPRQSKRSISPSNTSIPEPAPTSQGEFTLFNQLPIEIRLKIWHCAFPSARRIELGLNGCAFYRHPPRPSLISISCAEPNPVTLFINQESRHETLAHYTLNIAVLPGQYFYFDPRIDILSLVNIRPWIDGHFIKGYCCNSLDLFTSVQNLEIHEIIWTDNVPIWLRAKAHDWANSDYGPVMQHFLGLRELVLVPAGIKFKDPMLPNLKGFERGDVVELCRDEVKALFQREIDEGVDLKIPEIVIRVPESTKGFTSDDIYDSA